MPVYETVKIDEEQYLPYSPVRMFDRIRHSRFHSMSFDCMSSIVSDSHPSDTNCVRRGQRNVEGDYCVNGG